MGLSKALGGSGRDSECWRCVVGSWSSQGEGIQKRLQSIVYHPTVWSTQVERFWKLPSAASCRHVVHGTAPAVAQLRPFVDATGHLKASPLLPSNPLIYSLSASMTSAPSVRLPTHCFPFHGLAPILSFNPGCPHPCGHRSPTGIVFPGVDVVFPHYPVGCTQALGPWFIPQTAYA